MNSPNIYRWRDTFPGDPSEAFIRKHFMPPNQYRISRFIFPAGTRFPGVMRKVIIVLMAGSCNYKFGEIEFQLTEGDIAEMPGGSYDFSANEVKSVEFICVWKLNQEEPLL